MLLACLVLSVWVMAQEPPEHKPFKVDLGLGMGSQPALPAGLLLYLEPSYAVARSVQVGLKFEQAILSMRVIGSMALTGNYYVNRRSNVRFFVGGGLSYFNTTASGGCDPGPESTKTVRSTKHGGALVRTGIDFFHFRLGVEYNFVPSTYVSAVNANDQATSTVVYKNGYIGFMAGISIGGGKKTAAKTAN